MLFQRLRSAPVLLTLLAALSIIASPPAARAQELPAPWNEVPSVGGWQVSGGESPTLTSATRVADASTLVYPFPATSGPVEVAFTAQAPEVAGHRGLNFGLGWFRPERDAYRASLLTFGGAGQVIFWDPGGWFNVGPYKQGQPTRIRLLTDPSLGAYVIEIDGRRAPGLYPFFAGIPRVDSLYFSNASTRNEASKIRISDVRVTPYPAPSAPKGVNVRALSPTAAEVFWLPTSGAVKYFIYRKGQKVGEAEAGSQSWKEGGLPAGRPVAYSMTAVDAEGRESLPTWPVDALLPAYVEEKKIPKRYDLVVYGGTPAGIAAGIAAARLGDRVLLAIPGTHLGGMMSGGLGRTDYRFKGAQGGLFKEFRDRVQRYYVDAYGAESRQAAEANEGYHFEPSVAEAVFRRMLAEEPRVIVRYGMQLTDAEKRGNRLVSAAFETPGKRRERFPANAFIDATYEGDLMALAGAEYRVGRESSAEFNEEHAGVLYFDVETYSKLPGSTGEGDKRVQAYNYRLPLANRSGHRYYDPREPEGYDRERYANIPEDVKAGRVPGIARVIHFRRVPGEEFDVNNHRYYPSTDYVGHSDDYPEATPERRAEIAEEHRRHIEGLIYFLQNDPELPASFRFDANQWGFAQDEFTENGRFPRQLYVREARRMVGEATFTENDARLAEGSGRTPVHSDSIAVGEYMMDSHATRPQEPDRPMGVLEGFFFIPHLTKPYQIPYRIMVPKTVDGLLSVFASSATHAGFGTLRMEPVMMAMGEAAGTAARIANVKDVSLRNVPLWDLHQSLLRRGAVLTFFTDLTADHPAFEAYQYLGTLGLFDNYLAQPDAPVDRETARRWISKVAENRKAMGAKGGLARIGDGPEGVSRQELRDALRTLYPEVPADALLKSGGEGAADSPVTRAELAQALYGGLVRSRG